MLEQMYRAARGRVREIAATLDEEQLRRQVPATPEWTVHELLAHLVGGAADAVAGRLDGVTTDRWTARHVEERRHTSTGELMSQWERIGVAADATVTDDQLYGPNLAVDAICHESDLHEALGLARVSREHWQPLLEVMMLYLRKQLRHGSSLLIHDEVGQHWRCGSGPPATSLRVDGYELLRASYSRRSRRQIAAWQWSPAPVEDMVHAFGVFGTREDDQPIPRG
ncbi:hypothetical protein B1R94_19540 [Mycolicibacterium litorale]|nr:hypothetical protein B1R94_19540 [Mycolicibacterium litorale]